ncbi:TPA: endopeptidase La [Candidatus Dependentiae bacterium]|nr:MAG: Lon protease [candidate division TM6 bacterium GW2011_GWE2_31_21]KKP53487.1 MAG: Lon protease [candidate division TM6 bacterium GW2011_GWF2_33_332]HBS48271.1 endopeptidase La [Candidatus Dependentiae bacterium]HBZ73698.1 endopeptidase La [Candidatus Dependentiae bacterium]
MEETKKQNMEKIPDKLPVIPTMDVVVFPHMIVPLLVLDEQIIKGIEESLENSKKVILLATREQADGYQGPIGVQDLHEIGTVASIMRLVKLPEGGIKILVQGIVRAEVKEILTDEEILFVKLKPIYLETKAEDANKTEAQMKNITSLIEQMSNSGKIFGPDSQIIISQMKDPEKIIDFTLSHLNLDTSASQDLLEEKNLSNLLEKIYLELTKKLEISKVQEKIQLNARDSINKSQREYYLREQLKAIQKELGDDVDSDLEIIKKRLEETPLSQEAYSEAYKQFKRLEKIPPDSMEYTVLRNYLDWVVSLPWGIYTKDNLNIINAKKILDDDHHGLEEIKDRILDFLSVKSLKEDCHTPILCLAGPPGVGKTSLGQSIAKSIGRKFCRLSVGGVHDESEIRGHRRTYVGSMPGRFIQAIKKAGSSNPLIMIDEIDKIGNDYKGDPSSALLEVLDPEQNNTFYDNYLGLSYDLSKVMFITTANDLSTIPAPLRDRMEIIELSGYTHNEKIEIAKKHLVKKSIKNYGLEEKHLKIDNDTIDQIVLNYTREAGVRQLERLIQKLCAKFARSIIEENKPLNFTPKNLAKFLGNPLIHHHNNSHKNRIGVSNGLAWTPYGGEVLQVETQLMPGSGKLILTGQLGDVMKESAQAALTYARAHADNFEIARKSFTEFDLHIHLPAGAIPKDGPSAGITLLSAILSALTCRPINGDFAMTGELNLQGEVLPIGGLKEKILAAKQEGMKYIIIPKSNAIDLEKLGEAKKGINIILVDNVSEVLDKVLMPKSIIA